MLIDPNDFKSKTTLRIAVTNLDTGTEVRDRKKQLKSVSAQGGIRVVPLDSDISIAEFIGEKGMVLELPSDVGLKGQKLRIEIAADHSSPPFQLSVEGEVRKIERTDTISYANDSVAMVHDPQDRVTIELTGFDPDQWASLKSLFSSRQDEIEKFFRAARGY